jgi:ABC-2 type transport system ATP-binding protein
MEQGPHERSSARPVIQVEQLTKRFRLYNERNQSLKAAVMRRRRAQYEEFLALDDVSLDVREGSTVGFIGENGSGKSTLLKCIARILRPDHGTVRVEGKVSALLELGAGFHPELSGRENVFLNGTILGLSQKQIERRFDDIVDFAGLSRFIDTPVKNYSSGMYVRLGFSVAINVEPDVLVVDEVLAVGDETFQTRCNEKFAEMRHQGKTIVVVSHALGAVRSMCDEVVWLEHGKVRAIGAPGPITDAYYSEMHQAREASAELSTRWGSQEAVIHSVEMLDASGSPITKARTGDAVTFRLRYFSPEPTAQPVFGISIRTLEGVQVTNPYTIEAGVLPDKIQGWGNVDLHVPRLLLLPGTYDISVMFQDREMLHTYDFHQRALRVDIDSGDPHETYGGIMSLGGDWTIEADI